MFIFYIDYLQIYIRTWTHSDLVIKNGRKKCTQHILFWTALLNDPKWLMTAWNTSQWNYKIFSNHKISTNSHRFSLYHRISIDFLFLYNFSFYFSCPSFLHAYECCVYHTTQLFHFNRSQTPTKTRCTRSNSVKSKQKWHTYRSCEISAHRWKARKQTNPGCCIVWIAAAARIYAYAHIMYHETAVAVHLPKNQPNDICSSIWVFCEQ